jgi:MFS transporter, FHS family, glucose/mannose:H+ symporter
VPGLAYASNFLWVLVLGLLGPSLPAMIARFGISEPQAGMFFALLSAGSLLGTSIGGAASDRLSRKGLFAGCALALAAGLAGLAVTRAFLPAALAIFLLSLLGSPVGAIGQGIMLQAFPDRRERNLAMMTTFGAVGSLLAPLLVNLNYKAGLEWRWPFAAVAVLALALFVAILASRLPRTASPTGKRPPLLPILRNRRVVGSAVIIFFSIATDVGFSYWLALYFARDLGAGPGLFSSVVAIYLVGIIAGRFLIPFVLKRMSLRADLCLSLGTALAAIVAFILVPSVPVKVLLCGVYGLGVGPTFPLMLARGSREFPEQSGAVTGVLFAGMSLGGMVFPLLVGLLAARFGIARSYWFCAVAVAGLLVAGLAMRDDARRAAGPGGPGEKTAGG